MNDWPSRRRFVAGPARPKAGCTGGVAEAMDKRRVPGLGYLTTPALAVFVPGAAT